MKARVYDNPNKMHIETGCKTFDTQTNYIDCGNVIANTEFGWHVRGWWDEGEGLVNYPENKREPGRLFLFDIKYFDNLPAGIYDHIKQFAMERRDGMHGFLIKTSPAVEDGSGQPCLWCYVNRPQLGRVGHGFTELFYEKAVGRHVVLLIPPHLQAQLYHARVCAHGPQSSPVAILDNWPNLQKPLGNP